jgi:hypothetical protein
MDEARVEFEASSFDYAKCPREEFAKLSVARVFLRLCLVGSPRNYTFRVKFRTLHRRFLIAVQCPLIGARGQITGALDDFLPRLKSDQPARFVLVPENSARSARMVFLRS